MNGLTSQCKCCNEQIIYQPSQKTGKYCSNKCQQLAIYQEKTIPKIEKGECRIAPTLKKYLSEKRGYKCEVCNISDWKEKPLTLHLDHIDGNSDNNLPLNLRLLCPNCHSQTETFCGGNTKNSKRSQYNKRYRIRKLNLI
jgi:hypothetical protein